MSKKRILVNRDKVEVLSATCYIDQYYRDDSNDWHGAGDTVFYIGFLDEFGTGCRLSKYYKTKREASIDLMYGNYDKYVIANSYPNGLTFYTGESFVTW